MNDVLDAHSCTPPSQPYTNNSDGYCVPERDDKGTITIANKLKPQWHRDATTWKQFWCHWVYYWDLQGLTQDGNPEVIKMQFFFDCLPNKLKQRAQ